MKPLFILVISLLFYPSDLLVEDYSPKMLKKAEKQISKHFKENTTVVGFMPEDLNNQSFNSSFFHIKNNNHAVLGIAIITRANGCVLGGCSISNAYETRFEQFDMLSIYTNERELVLVSILDYPGEYGYEISAKWWLKQFLGIASKKHHYRQGIDAISGATVSAQSVVNEINELNTVILGLAQ